MALKLDLFKPKAFTEEEAAVATLIKRRRLQILVHSCIYYRMNRNLIDDHTFDLWSKELVQLQLEHPDISKRVELFDQFKDFDGSSGYDLEYDHPNIIGLAQHLVGYKDGKHEKV